MSYGTDHSAQWRRGAELVVNRKTAKAANFTVPQTIMIAPTVIE